MARDRFLEHWHDVWGCHAAGHSAMETAEMCGISTGSVLNYWRRLDLKPARCGAKRQPQSAPTLSTDRDGYVMLRWSGDPTYEQMMSHRKKRGQVRRCRWALTKELGRLLRATETVHHLNGDRSDDRIENLELRHGAHGPGVALRCAHCGSRDLEHA